MKIARLLVSGTGRTFVQETGKDVHCQYGRIPAKTLVAAKDGDVVESDSGEKLIVFTPGFIDKYKRIRRDAQIITFKDAGVILTTVGLGPESVVAEAGSGSGALTVLLSRHCKHVYSYEIKPEHLAVAQENISELGTGNVTFHHQDIATGILETDLDALILDMPEPWLAFPHIPGAVKVGGYIVTYVPSTVQLKHIHEMAAQVGLLHVRSVEVSERHWMVKGDAVRPTSKNVAFTAFLSFFRWLGPRWKDLRPQQPTPTPGWTLPDMEDFFELSPKSLDQT